MTDFESVYYSKGGYWRGEQAIKSLQLLPESRRKKPRNGYLNRIYIRYTYLHQNTYPEVGLPKRYQIRCTRPIFYIFLKIR